MKGTAFNQFITIVCQFLNLAYGNMNVVTSLYGTISYTANQPSDSVTYTITPAYSSVDSIIFAFTSINIQTAQMQIYDTNVGPSGTPIYSCASCAMGRVLPPLFSSSTGSVTIFFGGAQSSSFSPSSFSLQFVSKLSVLVPNLASLTQYALQLSMPYTKIQPILVNGWLPAKTVMSWTISVPLVSQIVISVSNFNFGNACSSRLSIYTALSATPTNLAFSGCTQADAPRSWIYAPNGQAIVLLTGGTSDQKISFTVTYIAEADLYHCGSLSQPDVQTDDSMIISDGSHSSFMRRAESCAWSIRPSPNTPGPVTLLLRRVSLMAGASVTVFDSTGAGGRMLWSGTGPSTTIPPPLTSLSGTLYIVYVSNTALSTGFYGFRGEYFRQGASSLGLGNRRALLAMSSALTVTPPWSNPAANVASSLVHQYLNLSTASSSLMKYTWTLSPELVSSSPDRSIVIVLDSLLLEGPSDVLTIQDSETANGPVLFRLTGPANGSLRHWLRTSGPNALVTLVTALHNNIFTPLPSPRSTFDLSYFADGPNYHCGFQTNNNGNVSTKFFYLTDGSASTQQMLPGQNCIWTLSSRDSRGVVLAFDRFDLRGASLSVYTGSLSSTDLWLTITNAPVVPAPLLVMSRRPIFIVFQSNNGVYNVDSPLGFGFGASYFALSRDASVPGDGVIRVRCASLVSLTLLPSYLNSSAFETRGNMTWIIRPTNASSVIYLSLSYLSFPDCDVQYLTVSYDNVAPLMFCGSAPTPSLWIRATSGAITVQYTTYQSSPPSVVPALGPALYGQLSPGVGFDLSYFSDGGTFHCGFSHNPAVMRARSMIISDGSQSTAPMFPSQRCEWLIKPYGDPAGSQSKRIIVLELLMCDMKGATLSIFDGSSTLGTLLWHCRGCSAVPDPIISSSGSVFIRFSSMALHSNALGKGFRTVYWTADVPDTFPFDISAAAEIVLGLPTDFSFIHMYPIMNEYVDPTALYGGNVTANTGNVAYAIRLNATTSLKTLRYYPSLWTPSPVQALAADSVVSDGRTATTDLYQTSAQSSRRQQLVCGTSTGGAYFATPSILQRLTQPSGAYLLSTMQAKNLIKLQGTWNHTTPASYPQSPVQFNPAPTCTYEVRSNGSVAINLNIRRFDGAQGGSLYVYGGGHKRGQLLWSRKLTNINNFTLQIPCGFATIVLQYVNASQLRVTRTPQWDGFTNIFGLEMDYETVANDHGQICLNYIASLSSTTTTAADISLYLIIAGGAVFVVVVIIVFSVLNRNKEDWERRRIAIKYGAKPVAAHPKYRPIADNLRNRCLLPGLCCICQDTNLPTIVLKCRHEICIEDMKAYLTAGLQDISKFPLKCPMHYEGCVQVIGPLVARRFLTASSYERFLDFLDRATLGEGVRCVFCNNFVKFAATGKELMVECTYCVRRFCMRCRKPWHYTRSCPLEAADDLELQNWKAGSGAQKCPGCSKLIEKEDPDTCNHMVHKITDSIPCLRVRTDFCYLCGVEVTSDYPHEEVSRPGVNHFPKGVFQCCLTVIESELKEELQRERARRKPKKPQKVRPGAMVVVADPVTPSFQFQAIQDMDDRRDDPALASVSVSASGAGAGLGNSIRRFSFLSVLSAEEDKVDEAAARASRNPSKQKMATSSGGGGGGGGGGGTGPSTTTRVRSPTSQLRSRTVPTVGHSLESRRDVVGEPSSRVRKPKPRP